MKIEFASRKNAAEIAELYKQWLEYKNILPDKLAEPDSYEDILKYFKKDSPRKYIIAKVDNKIVGVCYLDTSLIGFETIRIGDMIVAKEARRKGVGSAMLNWIISYAKENNVKKIWLWTQEELTPAIKLYEKYGFVFEGKQKSQFCGKDALLYGLVLS